MDLGRRGGWGGEKKGRIGHGETEQNPEGQKNEW